MLKRTVTGAFIAAAVYIILYYSHIQEVMLCATALLAAFSVYEIYSAANLVRNEAFLTISLLAAVGICVWNMPYADRVIRVAFVIALCLFFFMMIFRSRWRVQHPVMAGLIALTVVLLLKAIPVLRYQENGLFYLAGAITLCFITDIAAYLIGRKWGKHKLVPKISPNKTVEGSVAGICCAVIIALLAGLILNLFSESRVHYGRLAGYAALTSVVAQFGDLAMSAVKRICGIKDFGNIFPGHGGMLDRFDSHIFAIPFTLLFCGITGGYIV